MKKIGIFFVFSLLLMSCKSKKGEWTNSDKDKARDEVKKLSSSLEILGKNKEKCFDCYINELEKKYENSDSALNDESGCDQILMDCAIKYLHY